MFRVILSASLCCLWSTVQAENDGVWQQIREGASGYSAVTGPDTGILVQTSSLDWLYWRNELVAGTGAWVLALAVLALATFYLIRGQVKLVEPRSGEMIVRWNKMERWLHFYTAILFLVLMVTGLLLMYGRSWVIDWFGQPFFSNYVQLAKILHNYLGPLFMMGWLMMTLYWFKDNLFNRIDIQWFKQLGGLVGKQHPSAGRMNAGEKAWFWLLLIAGLAVSVSGLLLDFPVLGQSRSLLQLSHLVHSVSALLLIMGSLGHIYIGTIGTEGAFEGMSRGKVDSSWARQHHDLWYQELSKTDDIQHDNADKS